MIDVSKQIVFWKDSAMEDLAVARQLLRNFTASNGFVSGMYLIPLFFKEGVGEILFRTALSKKSPSIPL
ncbi:MAG: hypothetical protein ABFD45_04375 [Smithella sp.]|jgi:hypothetical protein